MMTEKIKHSKFFSVYRFQVLQLNEFLAKQATLSLTKGSTLDSDNATG